MARELKEVQGIIFKRQKYNEADVLAKIITKNYGIITMLARGALRPKSKLGAALLNFSYGTYIIYTNGHGLSNLRTYKNIKQFNHIFTDINKNAYSSFILDLIDHAFIEYQHIDQYYLLADFALQKINAGVDAEMITQIVQMQLLAAFGVKPELRHCIICRKEKGNFDYSIKYGGVLCSDHFYTDPNRLHLKPKETAVLRTIGLLPAERLGEITISAQTKKATRKAIDQIYQATIDLNLKTKKFLDELNLLT
ncbi:MULTISPECIES: DNA repair protein RecO [unclassified Lactobacillus]|uniref:DNA repair protein RecO n=1 Tax=unclassified Lactobacillus TaxID=2620435 RepID=UPI000EFAAC4F|nr:MULTISPECIES: DNA repair protein RecO [unclassified Lactobacillus]RMC46439.1 DNA repair protein RecO [Lactobacillus sp. ESL0230]RMC50740.1 DNA repair protein RecO [Lactobacillus sp. ESL0225]